MLGSIMSAPIEEFSWDKELERVSWFQNDLKNGNWHTAKSFPGAKYYIRTFNKDPFPVKMLYEWELSISADVVYAASINVDSRARWDKSFANTTVLETIDNGSGYVLYMKKPMPWPITDRDWVLQMKFKSFPERKSHLLSWRNAEHPSKPEQSNVIRAVNGSEFIYITKDNENPETACRLFCLSTNDLGGWLSTSPSTILGKVLPDSYEEMRQSMIKANEQKLFADFYAKMSAESEVF